MLVSLEDWGFLIPDISTRVYRSMMANKFYEEINGKDLKHSKFEFKRCSFFSRQSKVFMISFSIQATVFSPCNSYFKVYVYVSTTESEENTTTKINIGKI